MRIAINPRVFNVMNVKDMVISELSVPLTLRNKKKTWLFPGLMKTTHKEKLKMNLLRMSLL